MAAALSVVQWESVSWESESGMDTYEEGLTEFLEAFPFHLSYKQPQPCSYDPWVFWRENEEEYGNDSSSSSSSSAAADHLLFQNNLISLSSYLNGICWVGLSFVQFWVPVKIGGSRLLSASAQPFAITYPDRELALYRQYSAEYKYKIDDNYNNTTTHNEAPDHLIISGGPATAFLNRITYVYNPQWIPSKQYFGFRLKYSIMVPVCFPSQTHCIGVLELTMNNNPVGNAALQIIERLKQASRMDVCCDTQQHMLFKTINGLKPAKDKIEEALKVVCKTHKLALAQVWIAYEDKNHVSLSSSSLENPPKKAFKLGGYLHAGTTEKGYVDFQRYYNICDIMPEGYGSELALKTLKDYGSRCIFKLQDDIINWELLYSESGALAICLRSNETGDFDYALEFIWIDHPKSKYVTLLEGILLTLKGCLPGFKFASGAELGDETIVIDAEKKSAQILTSIVKIFQGKRSSPLPTELEKGAELGDAFNAINAEKSKQSETNNFMDFQEKSSASIPKLETGAELGDEFNVIDAEKFTHSETSNFMIFQKTSSSLPKELKKGKKLNELKCKTALIELPPEAIEEQFGKTMKEAAANLHVSLSTLKRKFKPLGIPEWPGPSKSGKRRENNSSIIQINTNEEEEDGAMHDASTVNIDKHMVTIKAEYACDIVKIHLPVSQATFASVEEKVGEKLKLRVGTYKLKYHDEDGDRISLLSDEDLKDCIKCSEKSDRIVVRLHVLPYPQQTHDPPGSS